MLRRAPSLLLALSIALFVLAGCQKKSTQGYLGYLFQGVSQNFNHCYYRYDTQSGEFVIEILAKEQAGKNKTCQLRFELDPTKSLEENLHHEYPSLKESTIFHQDKQLVELPIDKGTVLLQSLQGGVLRGNLDLHAQLSDGQTKPLNGSFVALPQP